MENNNKIVLRSFFKTDFPLNKDGVEELIDAFRIRKIPKYTFILNENEFQKELRFLTSGIVREFYRNNQKDININFYTRPQFITDLSAFMTNKATYKHQETLSDIEVLEIGKEKFLQLLQKYSCGKSFIDQSFRNILINKEAFEYNRMTKKPEELYQELKVYKPNWLQSIPQYHIASYLGITPETLSRIRKRIS